MQKLATTADFYRGSKDYLLVDALLRITTAVQKLATPPLVLLCELIKPTAEKSEKGRKKLRLEPSHGFFSAFFCFFSANLTKQNQW